MKEYEQEFNVTVMCRVLELNRSAYYHWASNGCIVNKVDEKAQSTHQGHFLSIP